MRYRSVVFDAPTETIEHPIGQVRPLLEASGALLLIGAIGTQVGFAVAAADSEVVESAGDFFAGVGGVQFFIVPMVILSVLLAVAPRLFFRWGQTLSATGGVLVSAVGAPEQFLPSSSPGVASSPSSVVRPTRTPVSGRATGSLRGARVMFAAFSSPRSSLRSQDCSRRFSTSSRVRAQPVLNHELRASVVRTERGADCPTRHRRSARHAHMTRRQARLRSGADVPHPGAEHLRAANVHVTAARRVTGRRRPTGHWGAFGSVV